MAKINPTSPRGTMPQPTSRGLGAVESAVLGSTTLAVMQLSSLPVTVVK
jgi:hypothetical protein